MKAVQATKSNRKCLTKAVQTDKKCSGSAAKAGKKRSKVAIEGLKANIPAMHKQRQTTKKAI